MYRKLLTSWLGLPATAPRQTPPRRRPGRHRPRLEVLEDRTLPSSYTAGTVADLIADINAANTGGGSNTITLVAGTTFTLTAVDNTTDGATGLPVIAANNTLTIVGNGDTIQRSTASGTPAFRLFDVASGASLTLGSLTVQNGLAQGNGVAAEGGALLNQGSLTLNGVTVQNNVAQGQLKYPIVYGQPNGTGAGGGIFSSGALTLNGVTVQNNTAQGDSDSTAAGGGIYSSGTLSAQSSSIQSNQALGGAGLPYSLGPSGFGRGDPGGSAFGGGLCISGGTATLTSVTVSSNTAQGGVGGMGGCGRSPDIGPIGGAGGPGGDGWGGGLYAGGGTTELHNVTVTGNSALGGDGGQGGSCGTRGPFSKGSKGSPGQSVGGGLYIDAAAAACLDAFTQSHVQKNHASSNRDIHGTYTTCP
jgi:hypothetical protein